MIDVTTRPMTLPSVSSSTPCLGVLYVVAAPSGTGKTSLTRALLQTVPDIDISISCTTRPKRPGEEHGKHYFFVTTDEFERMIAEQAFLEYAEVFGHYYGTSKQWVEKHLQAGKDVILEIDWQGAQQVRRVFPQSVHIFILPPSAALLRQRLHTRQQDSVAVIEQRLAAASNEVTHYAEFDYIVVNDQFDVALADLQMIIKANRLQRSRQVVKYARLLAELIQNR